MALQDNRQGAAMALDRSPRRQPELGGPHGRRAEMAILPDAGQAWIQGDRGLIPLGLGHGL